MPASCAASCPRASRLPRGSRRLGTGGATRCRNIGCFRSAAPRRATCEGRRRCNPGTPGRRSTKRTGLASSPPGASSADPAAHRAWSPLRLHGPPRVELQAMGPFGGSQMPQRRRRHVPTKSPCQHCESRGGSSQKDPKARDFASAFPAAQRAQTQIPLGPHGPSRAELLGVGPLSGGSPKPQRQRPHPLDRGSCDPTAGPSSA